MKKYDALEFLGHFAWLQSCRGGVGQSVKPIDCQREMQISRSSVYKHLKNLMRRKYITKTAYGRYAVNWDVTTVGIATSIVTYFDIADYVRNKNEFLGQFENDCKS